MHTINHAIIHKLVKEKHGIPTLVERTAALAISEPVRKLVLDIHELYAGRTGKGYGRFEEDETNYPSASLLRDAFQTDKLSFVEASRKLLAVLAAKASQAPLATGGYVLMAQITNAAGVTWFVAAIINNVEGSAINDNSLEVVKTVHVDLENLRVAGRVNLTEWLGNDPDIRYVGFLKQRGEVADYFKRFLGCNELLKNSDESKKLVTVLKGFSKDQGLTQEEEEQFFKQAYDFCYERLKGDEPLSLEALSNAIWPMEPDKLQMALAGGNVQISDGFVPDGRSISSLIQIKAKTPYWSIDLKRHALSQGYAKYNKAKGQLVLLNLPEHLKTELDREMSDGD